MHCGRGADQGQGQLQVGAGRTQEAEEALDGPEGEDLERARKEAGERGGMPERWADR
jgi:hypothetical protein